MPSSSPMRLMLTKLRMVLPLLMTELSLNHSSVGHPLCRRYYRLPPLVYSIRPSTSLWKLEVRDKHTKCAPCLLQSPTKHTCLLSLAAYALLKNLRLMEDEDLVDSSAADQPAWTATVVKFVAAARAVLSASFGKIQGTPEDPLFRFYSREADTARSYVQPVQK